MADYVTDHGFGVLNSQSFLLPNSSDLQRLSINSIVAGAKETCHEDVDALFLSCTGIRALDVVEQLENDLKLELGAVATYNDAIKLAIDEKDNGSKEVMDKILVESEDSVDWLEAQLHAIEKTGIENYLAMQLGDAAGD